MDSLPHSAQLIRSLLLSGLLLTSGFDAVADQRQNSHQSPSKYTANLDLWGPHPNKLKIIDDLPLWLALQEAERGKIDACQEGMFNTSKIYSSMAYEERIHENFAKGNGQPRRPLGEIADEVFRHAVEYEIGNPDGVRS